MKLLFYPFISKSLKMHSSSPPSFFPPAGRRLHFVQDRCSQGDNDTSVVISAATMSPKLFKTI